LTRQFSGAKAPQCTLTAVTPNRSRRHAYNSPLSRLVLLLTLFLGFAPLTISQAEAATGGNFPDVPGDHPAYEAIHQLTTLGIVHGYADGTFGPNDPVERSQAAGFVTRAMGLTNEDHGNPFRDQGVVDPELWRYVGTLQFYGVAQGYADGTYQPTQRTMNIQIVSLITRAMVRRGFWQSKPDDPRIYPNVPTASGHRTDLVTFVAYAGPLAGTSAVDHEFAAWDQDGTRAGFATTLWSALKHTPVPGTVAPPTATPTLTPSQSTVPAPTATIAPQPAVNPSGVALPIGDVKGWKQVLTEDFTAQVPLGSWPGPYTGKFGDYASPDTAAASEGTNSRWDAPQTVSVGSGMADYYLHTSAGTTLSAAIFPENHSQLYGRYVVRMRADAVPGYKTAFLLWPDSEVWPRDGEIDFPEGDLTGLVGGATHYQGGTSVASQDVFEGLNYTYTDWHTYVIEWTPTAVTYLIDGTVVHTTTKNVPSTPMHWVLQSERCLGGCSAPASASGHLQIDWVAMYSYAP
jgi:hypothetical protein